MKKTLLAAVIAGSLASTAAMAGPFALPDNTPLFFQYTNAEQFSGSNSIVAPGGPAEGNWGIMQLTSIVTGTALAPSGSDIQGGGAPIFFDQILPAGAQILGIFYGIQNVSLGAGGTRSTGGRVDLYWWDGSSQNVGTELASGANLAKRTAQNEYTGFTCASGNTASCTFLASLTFESGANPGDPGITIFSPTQVGTGDGTSKSYLSIDTSKVGAWTSQLDTNFFTLDPCNNPVGHNYVAGELCPTTGTPIAGPGGVSMTAAQDVRLDNNFSRNGATAWDGGGDIIGLRSNDPGRAFSQAVPEPASLALLGIAFAGLGFASRRRS